MRTYLKPGEMNDLFTMKAYIQLRNDGEVEKNKKNDKKKDKTSFG